MRQARRTEMDDRAARGMLAARSVQSAAPTRHRSGLSSRRDRLGLVTFGEHATGQRRGHQSGSGRSVVTASATGGNATDASRAVEFHQARKGRGAKGPQFAAVDGRMGAAGWRRLQH
jgi:hypothetical protein